jgi:hypothetical protein
MGKNLSDGLGDIYSNSLGDNLKNSMGDKLNGGLVDNLSNRLVDILSNRLGCNSAEPKPTTQSMIASIQKMIEELSKLLNNALQQNIQLGVQNAELMETNGDNH